MQALKQSFETGTETETFSRLVRVLRPTNTMFVCVLSCTSVAHLSRTNVSSIYTVNKETVRVCIILAWTSGR